VIRSKFVEIASPKIYGIQLCREVGQNKTPLTLIYVVSKVPTDCVLICPRQ